MARSSFLYTANGGNAGVADVQQGRSQFAGQARPPLPSDAGTTYIKLYLDGLCIDVHPSNSVSNISVPQVADMYHAITTNWNQVPGSNKGTTIHPYGRDTNGGTFNFFLQGGARQQAGGVERHCAHGRRTGQERGGRRSRRDRLLRSRLAGPVRQEADPQRDCLQREAGQEAQVPAVEVHLPGAADEQPKPGAAALRRLGPEQPDRGQDHREGGRCPGVQQGRTKTKKK